MAYTEPKIWQNEPLIASDLNTYVSDDLRALKDPPSGIYEANESSDLALASTSWADVDATEGKFQQTITTFGGDIMVGLNASLKVSGALVMFLDVSVDGTAYGVTTNSAADGLFAVRVETTASEVDGCIPFWRILQGIAAGAHVFKLRYKVSANTATIHRAAGTSNGDILPQFFVREMS